MDIGDIGFLIIAFIVFIVNFFVKAKKEKTETHETQKPAKQAPQKQNLPEPWEMKEPWELEETMPPPIDSPYQRDKKIDKYKRKKTPQASSVDASSQSYDTVKERIKKYQREASTLGESYHEDNTMEDVTYQEAKYTKESYVSELFQGNMTEELKKGIIYSEILHRKYE